MTRNLRIALAMLVGTAVAQAEDRVSTETASISVSGSAVVRVVPDEVSIRLRIESLDKDLRTSVSATDVRVQKLLDLTKEFKIEPRQVQTSFVRITRRTTEHDTFKGYEASSGVVVTLTDLARYSEFMARAVEVAQVLVDDIEFNYSKSAEKRIEARRMALQVAREKAVAMAEDLGQAVGRPITIEELPSSGWGSGYFGNFQAQRASGTADEPPDISTMAPGQMSVYARVQVRFELRPADSPASQPVGR